MWCKRCVGPLYDDPNSGDMVCTECGLVNSCHSLNFEHEINYENLIKYVDVEECNWFKIIKAEHRTKIDNMWKKYKVKKAEEKLALVKMYYLDQALSFEEGEYFTTLHVSKQQYEKAFAKMKKEYKETLSHKDLIKIYWRKYAGMLDMNYTFTSQMKKIVYKQMYTSPNILAAAVLVKQGANMQEVLKIAETTYVSVRKCMNTIDKTKQSF